MTSVRSIKLCYLDEIRRLPIQSLKAMSAGAPASSSTMETLKSVCVQTFPSLKGREFALKYSDEDKDVITVATDDELNEAFAVADLQVLTALRFDVVALTTLLDSAQDEEEEEEEANASVHRNVVCDGCNMHPIVGVRYKCSVRSDFDLCAACEKKDASPHAYLRIKNEGQAPAAVMTILRPGQGERGAGRLGQHIGQHIGQHHDKVREALAHKIAQVEADCADKVVAIGGALEGAFGGNGNGRRMGDRRGCRGGGGRGDNCGAFGGGGGAWSGPGLPAFFGGGPEEEMVKMAGDASEVRLECMSSVRDFGPFRLLRKPNGTAVFLKVSLFGGGGNSNNSNQAAKPWKGGGCLHIGRKGNVDMNGCGGPWASFHVEPCSDEGFPGIPNGLVRLVCGNRKFCLAGVNGRLVGVPASQVGPHTHFRINDSTPTPTPSAADPAAAAFAAEVAAAALTADENLAKELSMQQSSSSTTAGAAQAAASNNNLPPVIPTARFVEDMTVPDGTAMAPGQRFDKVWRVCNDGDAPFPAGCKLVHVGGELFSAPADGVKILGGGTAQLLQPLEEMDVAVPCVAPAAPGKYASYWRLATPSGAMFGHRLWIDISVTELESKEEEQQQQQQQEEEATAAPLLADSSNLGKPVAPPVPPAKTETVLDVLSGGSGGGGGAAAAAAAAEEQESAETLEAEKWEEVEAPATPSKQYSSSNPFLGGENEDEDEEEEKDANGGAAAELSASMEGAALAGSALNASGLSESVAAVVQASDFDKNLSKWNAAVTKITEMGFDDVTTILALLEKHATPETYESKLQVIVGELLSGMPMLN